MIVKWMKIVGLQVLLVSLGALGQQHRDYERDFEVFQAGGGAGRSQSIYTIYDEEDQKRAHGFESPLESFGSESKITYLPLYLSPDRVVRQYRSATEKYGKNDREGSLRSYDEFFDRNFGRDYNKYTAAAPLKSSEENEETEHETEAPRAGPRKPRKGSRKANYKVQSHDDAEELGSPYDYNYGGSSYNPSDEYQRIKSLSEQQAKEIQQNPSHCKVVQKEEMECHVCHDPKSGAKSESCSYASKPAAKKYAFVKERKYNSKDDEDEDEAEEEPAPKQKKSESLRAARRRPAKASKTIPAEATHAALVAAPARRRSPSRGGGKKSNENRPQRDVVGLDPYLYGGEDDEEEEEDEEEERPQKKQQQEPTFGKLKSYEDYFSHVFPEQHGKKSKEALKSESEYEFLPDYEHKKNVEEVLAEFKTRDWSKCKKSKKGDLTCYECKDPNGVLHEECMYVSESNPRSSRVTYEENKKYAEPEGQEKPAQEEDYDDEEDSSASEVVTERAAKLRQRKKAVDAAPKPEESLDQKLPKKRTIKRKVTYRKNSDPERLDKDESRVVYYEQKFTHTEN
ncbi:neurofilament heavy polypeptide-like [Lutzomyia longipalpis]|uniref:neurofilament heavy polypeptide-like n=1 Tax=Lutzomyia longipalpis TaxID=7200 RepID=UPI002483AB88|nr:neurofilament heavy polypeptide-like [Lutzomyia longipalpis]